MTLFISSLPGNSSRIIHSILGRVSKCRGGGEQWDHDKDRADADLVNGGVNKKAAICSIGQEALKITCRTEESGQKSR